MRIPSFYSLFAATAVSLGLLAVSSTSAQAVIINYDASAAIHGTTDHDHVLWIPGLGFVVNDFNSNGGVFSENTGTGTATLTGTVTDGAGNGFVIDALFSGFVGNTIPNSTDDAPDGSPKDEGYDDDAGNWRYYTSTSGTISGFGDFENQEFTLTRLGPSFQVGNGASGKNAGFGASGWLTITDVNDSSRTFNGDFNIDLGAGSTVPDTGATLLLLGLSLGLIRRFKRS